MKKLVVLMVMILTMSKADAQFFNPYMGQVMWDTMENIQMNYNLQQMQNQTMMMQMQYMNMVNANAAAATWNLMNNPFGSFGMVTGDGDYISTDNMHEYESNNVECSTCGGTGRVSRTKVNYSDRSTRIVQELCPDCHGKGYNRHLVKKEY